MAISHNVLATGSTGNAVVYNDVIMVDCGVKAKLVPQSVKLILLTHCHHDHFMVETISKLAIARPNLQFAGCEWLKDSMERLGVRSFKTLEIGRKYGYGAIEVSPVKLYHDVPNCGWRIWINDKKIFHATDTETLEGITAKNYDLYAIEFNYDADTIQEIIDNKVEAGKFSYEKRAIKNHLSFQQAQEFHEENRKESSKLIKLHMSSRYEQNNI